MNAWYNLGLAYKAQKDLPAASEAFLRSVKLRPKMIKANYMLAVVCWERKQNSKAVEYLNCTLSIDSSYSRAYYLLGVIYQAGHYPKLARKHFEHFLRLVPTGPSADRVKIFLERTTAP